MAKLRNSFKTSQMPWHANMTELNHLGAALIAKPEVFEGKMTQLFSAHRYSDNPLTSLLAGKHEINSTTSEWEWKMRGANTRPLVVMENVEPDSNTTLGKFKRTFRLKLDLDWLLPGDVIHPGNNDYQVRVVDLPTKHGQGFVYNVRIMTDDDQAFIPQNFVKAGQPWAKLFSQYEEAGEQSGSTTYSMPMTLKSRMSRYRKQYDVTGDAAQEVLAVKMQSSKGQWFDTWIKYAEAEYWEQWYRELERGYWYSKSTKSVLGANGRPIYSGPGIQELLKDSHVHHYSVLTARLIEEYLMDIFYSRVKPGKARKIKAFTGEYGMIIFHRAVADFMEKKGFLQVVDNTFIQKTSSEYNENALVAGYQYTKYRMANGAELELIHNPLYDDREINFEIDPVSGYPVESQRFTFLDFTGEDSSSNISLVNKTNSFKLGYTAGLTTPYGPTNKGLMSHSGDYYTMHVAKQCGVQIEDISKCGELILSRN